MKGTTHFTTLCCTLVVILTGLAGADIMATGQQISAAYHYQHSGGNIRILTAEGRINPTACERLTKIHNVIAAGAIRETHANLTLATLPDAPVPVYDVTPGFPTVLHSTGDGGDGISAPEDITRMLDVRAGDGVATTQGMTHIKSVYEYPADGRRAGFGYAVLSETIDSSPFDECWVTSWPEPPNLRSLLLTSIDPRLTSDTESIDISQLNPTVGARFRGHAQFSNRITRFAAPLGFLLAMVLGYLSTRIRRLQNASALHSGVHRGDILTMTILESGSWSLIAAMITTGSVIGQAALIVPAHDLTAVAGGALVVPLVGSVGALLGASIGVLTTNEKHLFRYFKER